MGVQAPVITSGGTMITEAVKAEVTADWSDATLYDSLPGTGQASVITFALGAGENAKSNQQYRVLRAARKAAAAAMGQAAYDARIAAGHEIRGASEIVPAVPAVKANASKGIAAADAIPAMLTVQTEWRA